ncbi:heme utilization cystosolic carrier protein HutX [Methylophaga sp.]|uniref:heme utilization cystosolic carrier protein HutX n=1 Tax=Methylophaga sp. TaxID=2024840 RepID=UPI003F69C632
MSNEVIMPGDQAQTLLEQLADWGTMVTIIIHGGSVFEFKGPFPKGSVAEGFYNLNGPMPGFHGHLNLKQVKHIRFQDKAHRGRESYAFVFENADDEVIFKVFIGRDDKGELLAEQKQRFLTMQQHYQ